MDDILKTSSIKNERNINDIIKSAIIKKCEMKVGREIQSEYS